MPSNGASEYLSNQDHTRRLLPSSPPSASPSSPFIGIGTGECHLRVLAAKMKRQISVNEHDLVTKEDLGAALILKPKRRMSEKQLEKQCLRSRNRIQQYQEKKRSEEIVKGMFIRNAKLAQLGLKVNEDELVTEKDLVVALVECPQCVSPCATYHSRSAEEEAEDEARFHSNRFPSIRSWMRCCGEFDVRAFLESPNFVFTRNLRSDSKSIGIELIDSTPSPQRLRPSPRRRTPAGLPAHSRLPGRTPLGSPWSRRPGR